MFTINMKNKLHVFVSARIRDANIMHYRSINIIYIQREIRLISQAKDPLINPQKILF